MTYIVNNRKDQMFTQLGFEVVYCFISLDIKDDLSCCQPSAWGIKFRLEKRTMSDFTSGIIWARDNVPTMH